MLLNHKVMIFLLLQIILEYVDTSNLLLLSRTVYPADFHIFGQHKIP